MPSVAAVAVGAGLVPPANANDWNDDDGTNDVAVAEVPGLSCAIFPGSLQLDPAVELLRSWDSRSAAELSRRWPPECSSASNDDWSVMLLALPAMMSTLLLEMSEMNARLRTEAME